MAKRRQSWRIEVAFEPAPGAIDAVLAPHLARRVAELYAADCAAAAAANDPAARTDDAPDARPRRAGSA